MLQADTEAPSARASQLGMLNATAPGTIAPETGFNLDLEQSVLLTDEVVSERSVGGGVVTRF
jgi:hypothetical protein